MNDNIVKIERITVLKESKQYVILFQAQCGMFEFYVDMVVGKNLESVLYGNQQSVLNQIMNSFDSSERLCKIKKIGYDVMASLTINGKIYSSSLEEILPIALEINAMIFIDDALFQNDYNYDKAHEQEVEVMLHREAIACQNARLREYQKEIENAIYKEQYEYAAILRNKFQLLTENNGK
ncbi:MAG: hypothetical protein ACRCTJ_03430 [Brevinema sp.]